MNDRKSAQQCNICGDQVCGLNYGIFTCKSCKVFFHRNANRDKKLNCHDGSNKCPMTIKGRKLCAKCRLRKCLSLGMNRQIEAISEIKYSGKSKNEVIKNHVNVDHIVERRIRREVIPVSAASISGKDDDNPDQDRQTRHLLRSPSIIDTLTTKRPKDRHSRHNRRRSTATPLTAFEHEQILIAKIANECTMLPNEQDVRVERQSSDLIDVFKIPEIYFRSIVKYCKSYCAFNRLSRGDQFRLLKPFCFDALLIRFAFIYDRERHGFPMFDDDDPRRTIFVVYDSLPGNTNHCDKNNKNNNNNHSSSSSSSSNHNNNTSNKHYQFRNLIHYNLRLFERLRNDMHDDPLIRDLLTAQSLFSHRHEIHARESIQYQYALYTRLLRRYLQHKFASIPQADRCYSRLMRAIGQLEIVKRNERLLFSQFDHRHIPELVIEMYDLI